MMPSDSEAKRFTSNPSRTWNWAFSSSGESAFTLGASTGIEERAPMGFTGLPASAAWMLSPACWSSGRKSSISCGKIRLSRSRQSFE